MLSFPACLFASFPRPFYSCLPVTMQPPWLDCQLAYTRRIRNWVWGVGPLGRAEDTNMKDETGSVSRLFRFCSPCVGLSQCHAGSSYLDTRWVRWLIPSVVSPETRRGFLFQPPITLHLPMSDVAGHEIITSFSPNRLFSPLPVISIYHPPPPRPYPPPLPPGAPRRLPPPPLPW